MKCGWCDREDELTAVEVTPAVFTGRDQWQQMTKAPVMVMACPDHRGLVWDPSPDVRKIRRRKARGFQQTTIFDQLPEEAAEERKDRSALHQGTR